MLACDGIQQGPSMKYASFIKHIEVTDSAEIRSNIKLDENYLKGYRRYDWSIMINMVGFITGTWSKTIYLLRFAASAFIPESNRYFTHWGGVRNWKIFSVKTVKTVPFLQGIFKKGMPGRVMLAVTNSLMILSADAALVNLIPFQFAPAVAENCWEYITGKDTIHHFL